MLVTFEGELVRLRAHRRDDLPTYVKWIGDPEVASYLSFYRPVALEEEERWFQGIVSEQDSNHFAIETVNEQLIGVCGLHSQHNRFRSSELGIFIGDKVFWGKGYGSEAVHLLLHFGFGSLNLHRIYLHVLANNPRAIRCYEKCGFQHEGCERHAAFKNGEYIDVLVMGILEDEFRAIADRAGAGRGVAAPLPLEGR
jgi:RimJ/RimL family protein N-acetyltransferase